MSVINSPTSSSTPVSDKLISRCLSLYKPEFIHIRDAKYADFKLSASFDHYPLDFHREPLDHLSRAQIVHYLGQAAFVMGGCLAVDDRLAPMTDEDFILQVSRGHCTFRKLELEFRRFLPNTGGTKVDIICRQVRRTSMALMVDLQFELNDRACYGSALAVIPKNE